MYSKKVLRIQSANISVQHQIALGTILFTKLSFESFFRRIKIFQSFAYTLYDAVGSIISIMDTNPMSSLLRWLLT